MDDFYINNRVLMMHLARTTMAGSVLDDALEGVEDIPDIMVKSLKAMGLEEGEDGTVLSTMSERAEASDDSLLNVVWQGYMVSMFMLARQRRKWAATRAQMHRVQFDSIDGAYPELVPMKYGVRVRCEDEWDWKTPMEFLVRNIEPDDMVAKFWCNDCEGVVELVDEVHHDRELDSTHDISKCGNCDSLNWTELSVPSELDDDDIDERYRAKYAA